MIDVAEMHRQFGTTGLELLRLSTVKRSTLEIFLEICRFLAARFRRNPVRPGDGRTMDSRSIDRIFPTEKLATKKRQVAHRAR